MRKIEKNIIQKLTLDLVKVKQTCISGYLDTKYKFKGVEFKVIYHRGEASPYFVKFFKK